MSSGGRRLVYFDILKGMAIYMVVIGHVIAFGIRGIDSAPVFKFIGEIHMPLFFFISGWMSWRAGKSPSIPKRALQLLVPMALCSWLWVMYFPSSGLESPLPSSFEGMWQDKWKNGYWFTLVLFEIIVIYSAMLPALRRCRNIVQEALVWIAVFVAILCLGRAIEECNIYGYLSWGVTLDFFLIFGAGAMCGRHAEGFIKLTENRHVYTTAAIIFAVTLYIKSWYWEFPWLSCPGAMAAVALLLHFSLAVVAVAAVRPWSESGSCDALLTRSIALWCFLGRNSLAIYLLHYFFLFPLGWLRPYLIEMNLALVPVLAIAAFAGALIVAAVLLAVRLLKPSGVLSWFLCGNIPANLSRWF